MCVQIATVTDGTMSPAQVAMAEDTQMWPANAQNLDKKRSPA
jgi:hypothetical protein